MLFSAAILTMGNCNSLKDRELEEQFGDPLDVSRKGPSSLGAIPGYKPKTTPLEPAKPEESAPTKTKTDRFLKFREFFRKRMSRQELEEQYGDPLDVSRKGPSSLSAIPGYERARA